MSNYFQTALLKPQYFNTSYLHGKESSNQQDGKSGYWRLFFYQLQEAELNKSKDLAEKVQTPEKITETVKVKRKVVPKPLHRKPVENLAERDYIPPFRPLPPFRILPVEHSTIFDTERVLFDIGIMRYNFQINLGITQNLLDAANDEDDVELLLLVA